MVEPATRTTELVNQRTKGASEKRLVKLSSVIDEGTKSPASAKIRSAWRMSEHQPVQRDQKQEGDEDHHGRRAGSSPEIHPAVAVGRPAALLP